MHVWVQQSAEAFKFEQYVISIVLGFLGTPCTGTRVSKKKTDTFVIQISREGISFFYSPCISNDLLPKLYFMTMQITKRITQDNIFSI
jgi:hypothetical protein